MSDRKPEVTGGNRTSASGAPFLRVARSLVLRSGVRDSAIEADRLAATALVANYRRKTADTVLFESVERWRLTLAVLGRWRAARRARPRRQDP